jgi:hypothetical protein
VGKTGETDHMEESGVVGRIILSWIFRKYDVGLWTESRWLRIGRDCEHL